MAFQNSVETVNVHQSWFTALENYHTSNFNPDLRPGPIRLSQYNCRAMTMQAYRTYKKLFCSEEFSQSKHTTKWHNRKCSHCFKVLQSDVAFQNHLLTHTSQKDYECHFCQKCFTSQNSLNVHKKQQHTENITYECLLCPKGFSSLSNRNKHVRKCHKEGNFSFISNVDTY